jgi:hypothetical protein
MSRALRTITCAAVLMASPAAGRADDPPADAIAQRFFAHLEANQPIAGEFVVVTTVDQSGLPAAPKAPGAKGDFKTVPEPAKQTLNCRWAWATDREVCQKLPGSHDSMYGFLSLPEGSLIGYTEKQYNLVRPDTLRSDVARPALFYFLGGASPWKKQLAKARFSLRPAADRPETDTLVAEGDGITTVLILDRKTSRLRSAEIAVAGKVGWRLAIDGYATSPSDARVFPTAATITTYAVPGEGASDKPIRTTTLAARKVEFPTPAEAATHFRLPVPPRALIGDRILNAAIEPDRPTDAAEIITQDVPRKPFSAPPRPPTGTRPGSFWSRSPLIVALLALPFVGYGAYALVRYLRSRGAAPPQHQPPEPGA